MKRLLLPLLAAIALPSSIFAEPIPKISDYELSVDIGEKIEFKCPVKRERDKKEKRIKVLEKVYNDKVRLDHGMVVGSELANVLSGGETTIDKTLSENDLYNLELESFMRLIETKKTQDRINHTLSTGKPLVN